MSRLRWQPPAIRPLQRVQPALPARDTGVGRAAVLEEVESPPGRSTRRTSASAALTSGIVQSVNVESTRVVRRVRGLQPLTVEAGALDGTAACPTLRRDSRQPTSDGSTASTRTAPRAGRSRR